MRLADARALSARAFCRRSVRARQVVLGLGSEAVREPRLAVPLQQWVPRAAPRGSPLLPLPASARFREGTFSWLPAVPERRLLLPGHSRFWLEQLAWPAPRRRALTHLADERVPTERAWRRSSPGPRRMLRVWQWELSPQPRLLQPGLAPSRVDSSLPVWRPSPGPPVSPRRAWQRVPWLRHAYPGRPSLRELPPHSSTADRCRTN